MTASAAWQGGLTLTAPEGATCGLYPQLPASLKYFQTIDPKNAIGVTYVTTEAGITAYHYDNLEPGIYHYGVSMAGCNAVCQVINYTAQKAAEGLQIDVRPDKLAGNGYEAGYVVLDTREFIDAHMASEKDSWGEAYAGLFRTPQFLREPGRPGRHQQTTNEELAAFIGKLENPHMHVYSLGKSPKYGYDLPLVLFTREDVTGMTLEQAARIIRGNGKPTVQYTAQCHSTEPASCEGALAMMLQLCGDFGKVLEAVDVYIVPRINADGAYEVLRGSPTTGEDMNRDYLRMHNREIRMVVGAYNLFLPEVAIDGHEKMYPAVKTEPSICEDVALQVGAGSLNHPAEMTALGVEIAREALGQGRQLGLRTHFYTKLASAAGGAAGSSYFGTRNSLSFLIETPGQIHLGMNFMERRVLSHYVSAAAIITYAARHARQVLDTVHASREKMRTTGPVYDEKDHIVLEPSRGETGTWTTPLIQPQTGEVIQPDYCSAYKEEVAAVRSRSRATAYLLPLGLPQQEEILRVVRCHAIGHYQLAPGSAVRVQRYRYADEQVSLTEPYVQRFEQGAIVFPNTVISTILGVIMEPDFGSVYKRKMTLLSMGLIQADGDGNLPEYRYCHDLADGKVTVE